MADELDEKAAWVRRILGLDVAQAGVSPASVAAPAQTDAEAVAALQRELTGLIGQIPQAAGGDAGRRAELVKLASVANDSLKQKALDAAEAGILKLNEALKQSPATAANGAEAGGSADTSAPVRLLARWLDARRQAHETIVQIGRTLLDLPEVQSDPRFERVRTAVAALPALIPDFGDQTDGRLSPDTVATWRRQLDAAAALSDVERFAQRYVGDFPVYSILDEALAGISSALPTAA